MTIEVTCQCGRVLHAPESAIGRKGRCKGCGATIEIVAPEPEPDIRLEEPDDQGPDDIGISLPTGVAIDDADDLQAMVRRATPTANAQQPVTATAPQQDRKIPPEPWYYQFLVGYATLCIVLGTAQFIIITMIALSSSGGGAAATESSVFAVLMSLAWMLGLTLVASPILLAVDAARNVRAMRYDPREGRG